MELANNNTDQQIFDEFSPKQLIIHFQSVIGYLRSKWLPIILTGLLLSITTSIYYMLKKPTYVAEITFALDEEANHDMRSSFTQLSKELGLSSGGVGSDAVFNSIPNIVELMKSRLLVEKALRSSVNINGKTIVFADFFLDSLNYRDKWMKDNPSYQFNTVKNTDSVRMAYNGTLHGRATFADLHVNTNRQIAVVSAEKEQTDVQILKASYIELIKNLEGAKIALVRITPLIQYVDTPILPLKKQSSSVAKNGLIFFFIGVFIATAYFFMKRLIEYLMM
ncbi:MAG: hypothetical protein HY305_02545 [Sphingobacteriales bacterium]|nr:hypothetical protein [Sphingobacteriales bacterium]